MTTNDKLLHKSLAKGIIFNDFFEIIAFQSGEFKSHSDIMLWSRRKAPKGGHLTSGHAELRNFRKWGAQERIPAKENLIEVGAWRGLHDFLTALKATESNKHIVTYLSFCLHLCEIERTITSDINSSTNDALVQTITQWFCLDTMEYSPLSIDDLLDIHRLMLWAALYEQYIEIAFPGLQSASTPSGNHTSLIRYLPEVGTKGDLITSIEMLFDHLLKKTGYNSAQELYEAMSSSQPLRKLDKEDAKDPKSIRTKFDRWKKGTSPFTTKSFKNTYQHLLNINIEEYDESLLLIVFINIFSQKQRLLLEADVSPEAIAEAFSTYPRYRDKVNHNWEHFKLSLAPARVE